jgi:hypothetical protein
MRKLVLCLAVLTVSACSPPNRSFSRMSLPALTSMTCTLKTVHNGVLNPTYFRDRGSDTLTFVYRDIGAASARVEGNNGAQTVEVRRTETQMQFIETTMTGNLTVTTVFAPSAAGEAMPSVHSRHIEIAPANVSISQFAGECLPT